jgi:hypothetical protein
MHEEGIPTKIYPALIIRAAPLIFPVPLIKPYLSVWSIKSKLKA